jgi:hypothetical protein
MKMSIKLSVLVILLGLLISCNKKVRTVNQDNQDSLLEKYEVKLLFEQDSVKVYEFFANGRYHYFTSRGTTSTVHTNGKTSYTEEIEF